MTITVPVPGAPTVHSVDGEYNHDRRDQVLEWTIPEIDSENAEGSMEFTVTDVQSVSHKCDTYTSRSCGVWSDAQH